MVVVQRMVPGHQHVQSDAYLGHTVVPRHGHSQIYYRSKSGDQNGIAVGHCPIRMVAGFGRLCPIGFKV